MKNITIIGAGLAGSEAALQLADKGWNVTLYEMRPRKMTPAHETDFCAEVVCSNSFKSELPTTAGGLLKQEMQAMGCALLPIAQQHRVPAGNALAIDRAAFGKAVTRRIESHPRITFVRKEITSLPAGKVIIATGPLTSDGLTATLLQTVGNEQLYFFDAIAPIVSADSIDRNVIYEKTRYDKGNPDYLNIPLNRQQYDVFVEALNAGQKHEAHEFESDFFDDIRFQFYENCTPIEELARRGRETLRYGVMRGVGLENPITGEKPYAALQLRAENTDKTAYNLVGCQTMLTYGEQKRILRTLPGLENAVFLRYGSIHRNTFLNGPHIFNPDFSLKLNPELFIAGQLAGVEGYVESILSGMLVAQCLNGNSAMPPEVTITGQLWRHLILPKNNFQPMNANFGLLPALETPIRDKRKKKEAFAHRSMEAMKKFLNQ
ncbi:MAG: methylenetetrahydrofolate--tRNA-(uracil(54)-C(5))-methyltransferase (FADH(2)-oxidizing) TrmFO [Candidatus Cloacimonetes bacterium]|nr:methylenetetrahydrofolate--tRNA-(uracil(54)-C(5))-methyltransferase (FADH(2)-oxidizing) TrmFO [Candidatus Cloacimonadota bacterium]